jgi:non-specific serine/threonine protein kinase
LLSDPERRLLRTLAVFSGGWTLEVIEARFAEPEVGPGHVLDRLGQLVEKSLVIVEENAGKARFRLLETVRQYAWNHLRESGEITTTRDRHRDWAVELAEQAGPAIERGPQRRQWLDRLETEIDNLRAALAWCLETDSQIGLRLAGLLHNFWYWRGYHGEGQRWLDRLLARAPAKIDPRVQAEALLGTGRFAYLLGDYGRAKLDLEESLNLFRALGDQSGSGWALNFLGQVALVEQNATRAQALLEESLTVCRVAENKAGAWWALHCLGDLAGELAGDSVRARALHEKSLALARKSGDQALIGEALFAVGTVERAAGNYARARDLMEQSLPYYRDSGDRVLIGWVIGSLGDLARIRGDDAEARRLFGQGLFYAWQIDYRKQIAAFLSHFGILAVHQGDHRRGARLLGGALAVDPLVERVLTRDQAADYNSSLATARAALTDDVFTASWVEGQETPLEQVVGYELAETPTE